MCTVVILRRPNHHWPLILGANRDEQMDRPWRAPARHWHDRPNVVGGLDELAGGSWMGLNDSGMVACILNRRGTLGPQANKRSRGEIVLEALDHQDAVTAADALSYLDGNAYRGFNLLLADNKDAFWLKLDEDQGSGVMVSGVPYGISMLTAGDLNDPASDRISNYTPKFSAASAPDPMKNDWAEWQSLMGDSSIYESPLSAMCFSTADGFGTSSSSLLALPSVENSFASPQQQAAWLFAAGPPDSTPFKPISR